MFFGIIVVISFVTRKTYSVQITEGASLLYCNLSFLFRHWSQWDIHCKQKNCMCDKVRYYSWSPAGTHLLIWTVPSQFPTGCAAVLNCGKTQCEPAHMLAERMGHVVKMSPFLAQGQELRKIEDFPKQIWKFCFKCDLIAEHKGSRVIQVVRKWE